jgi:DNA-binding transcriptional LysR family regulator
MALPAIWKRAAGRFIPGRYRPPRADRMGGYGRRHHGLGDEDADLVRALPGPVPDPAGELWIVTRADLKRTARVRAFFDLVGEGLAREHSLFDGRG